MKDCFIMNFKRGDAIPRFVINVLNYKDTKAVYKFGEPIQVKFYKNKIDIFPLEINGYDIVTIKNCRINIPNSRRVNIFTCTEHNYKFLKHLESIYGLKLDNKVKIDLLDFLINKDEK